MISAFIHKIYGQLYYVNTLHEEREAGLIVVELVLIFAGLITFAFDILDTSLGKGPAVHPSGQAGLNSMFWVEHWKDVGELLIFLLLSASLIARETIRRRRKALGYDFRPVLSLRDRHGHLNFDGVLQSVQIAQWGFAPEDAPQPGFSSGTMAEAIAAASAGILSERSWGREDNLWFTRERDYIADWISAFKSCIWLVPDAPGISGQPSGYASVIVPITNFSARSIRRGHRATDTAEIDPGFLTRFRSGDSTAAPGTARVQFLAYAQVCVSDIKAVDSQKLLNASVQHLAMLLHGRFGAHGDFRARWRFAVLCESANPQQEQLLTGLGFRRLPTTGLDKERAHRHPGRSFAGFPLLELRVDEGVASHDDKLIEAERFLLCLAEMVRRYDTALRPQSTAPAVGRSRTG